MSQADNQSALFDYYGKPSFSQASPLAIQHVVTAIVGCVTSAIIVSGTAGLNPTGKILLIQTALVVAGLATLLQPFPIGNKNGLRIGAALPMIMDVNFAYVPSIRAIAGHESGLGVPMILGAQIVGDIMVIIVGSSIKEIRRLFPPLIAGTVAFTVDLSLYPTTVNYMAGGTGKPLAGEIGKLGFGSWQSWTVTLITLAVVTALNRYVKSILKLASIPIGIIVGCAVAPGFGLVDLSGVASVELFQFPTSLHFGVALDPSSCVAIGLLFAISSIQAIGDSSTTTTGSVDRMPENKEFQGGIVGYGISNIIGAVLGGLPTTTYSQNVGIVVTTKIINHIVLGIAAVILLVAGLIPRFLAVLTTIPQCVLGGATITVFAPIATTGIKLVMIKDMSYRNTSIVGLSVVLGTGATQTTNSLAASPDWVTTTFGRSPVVVTACAAILPNVILPRESAAARKN